MARQPRNDGTARVSCTNKEKQMSAACKVALLCLGVAACGPPMGVLKQGVTGPHASSESSSDLTVLISEADPITTQTGSVFIQAVVDSIDAGSTVTATLTSVSGMTSAQKSFNATQTGDVGLQFEFDGPFPVDGYTVTVSSGGATIGNVQWAVSQ